MKSEQEILEFWQKNRIFEKAQIKGDPDFIFYEGPPTANGRPGIHHVLARSYKDAILRFQTMVGKKVIRRAGWDTHGLPVELEVEKKLGISGKKQIENIIDGDKRASMIKFNQLCRESVWQYKSEWEDLTQKTAFWLDLDNPYITYQNEYISNLWGVIKKIWDKKLLVKNQKTVPYCPRCETVLSSHELAQGYKDANDPSLFSLFKLKNNNQHLLVWTTTPWTLPANLAIVVDPKENYGLYKFNEKNIWLAIKLARINGIDFDPMETKSGKNLDGLEYEPLYPNKISNQNCYKIYSADFVQVGEGTGLVHIAPGFGEDDYEFGKKNDLPFLVTINDQGIVISNTPGKGNFIKDADKEIITDLQNRGLVYKSERIVHTYPFCWRCSTPVIYVARESWFILMSKLREKLISENEKISWIPAHLKEGRFGNWLTEVKDWAFSRERYWGTPLPIWICQIGKSDISNLKSEIKSKTKIQNSPPKADQPLAEIIKNNGCGHTKVIGSEKELAPFIKNRNKFIFIRHGESEKNVLNIVSSKIDGYPLTKKGIEQAQKTANFLKNNKITKIYSSPVERATQTANVIARLLGLEIIYDNRLVELGVGQVEGKPVTEEENNFKDFADRWTKNPDGIENFTQVTTRMVDFITEVNSFNQNETIVIVSHGDPLWLLEASQSGKDNPDDIKTISYINYGEHREVNISAIDLHRPYIDDVMIPCEKCSGIMVREPYVCDVWFDSGAMPFASGEVDAGRFPADYICEAIDQTRGWFYTLLAIGVLMDKGTPYKKVISLNHILDSKGQKMSKSKGNIVDPWEMIDKYSADSVRLYFFSVNQPGDNKLFSEKDLATVHRQTSLLLDNILNFILTYAKIDKIDIKKTSGQSNTLLDNWLLAKLALLIEKTHQAYQSFDLTTASRGIIEFVNELSTWYLKNSRKNRTDNFYATLRHTLNTLSKIIAPLAPFCAELLYQTFHSPSDPESVHLCLFPDIEIVDTLALKRMERIREIVGSVLSIRSSADIKLRQPLQSVFIYNDIDFTKAETDLIVMAVNVLNVKFVTDKNKDGTVDLNISPRLKEEGQIRDIIRLIQDARKSAGLQFSEVVNATVTSNINLEKFKSRLEQETLTKVILKSGIQQVSVSQ